jgi:hypothetical protein
MIYDQDRGLRGIAEFADAGPGIETLGRLDPQGSKGISVASRIKRGDSVEHDLHVRHGGTEFLQPIFAEYAA